MSQKIDIIATQGTKVLMDEYYIQPNGSSPIYHSFERLKENMPQLNFKDNLSYINEMQGLGYLVGLTQLPLNANLNKALSVVAEKIHMVEQATSDKNAILENKNRNVLKPTYDSFK